MTLLNTLVVSAPAKVILHGEHAVVYGKVALAASLDLRTTLTWSKLCEDKVELELTDLGFQQSWTISQLENLPSFPKGDITRTEAVSTDTINVFKTFLHDNLSDIPDVAFSAALTFLLLYKMICDRISGCLFPGKYVIKSEIPVGAGLGSSASYSVVLVTSLLVLTGEIKPELISSHNNTKNDSLKLINQWAFEGEKLMHGNPSGIDNTISTYGGFLQYQSGNGETLDISKSVLQLNIILVNTNVPRSTKTMVGGLRQRYLQMPAVYEPLFTAMGAIALECIQVLSHLNDESESLVAAEGRKTEDHFHKLKKLIDLNQELLRIVGVSHHVVDKVCKKTLEYGLHSKLTGAGGGGCVITLTSDDVKSDTLKNLCDELEHIGCASWRTKLGGNGVLLHEWS